MQPKEVAFFRSHGTRDIAAREAWETMEAWIKEFDLGREVPVRFGLFNLKDEATGDGSYDACIELPNALLAEAKSRLRYRTIPSGAYARQRHIGPHEDLDLVIEDVAVNCQKGMAMMIDEQRPIVEIYFNTVQSVPDEKLRTDVCLPVRIHDRTCAA